MPSFLQITLHGSNLESVYKVFPMEILPEEYLPDEYTGKNAGSCQSITGKYWPLIMVTS